LENDDASEYVEGVECSASGVDEHRASEIERLRDIAARDVGIRPVTLFSLEHDIRGMTDRENLASGNDERSRLTVDSTIDATTRSCGR
jgi:hypothetical protein